MRARALFLEGRRNIAARDRTRAEAGWPSGIVVPHERRPEGHRVFSGRNLQLSKSGRHTDSARTSGHGCPCSRGWRERACPSVSDETICLTGGWHNQDKVVVARRATTASISSAVVCLPRLKRIAPIPIRSGTRIAARTGESSICPEWHAEPVDAATLRNWPNISAPILPTNDTLRVFGKRCVGWPLSATSSLNLSCSAF